jgi:thioredoxin reductase
MTYDVVIVGGGPAGLSAALALGRACRRVLLCDSGARRNAAATHVHNFVTRDGTPPDEFRGVARAQLEQYSNVELDERRVLTVEGSKGAFRVALDGREVEARRVLLCTGMIDELLPLDGFAELWGHAIAQCPYCHGWELRERPWGYLAHDPALLHFAVMLRGWSREVTVFTDGAFELGPEQREWLAAQGIRVATGKLVRLRRREHALEAVELADEVVPCELLFAHPPQRQVELVRALGLELDADGYVRVDALTRETSMPGVYAAGDLSTRMQGAIFSAALGTQAAAMLNHELVGELIAAGLA